MKETLQRIVAEELAPLGFELVELKMAGSKGRPVVDIRIDRLDLEKVQVGDCELASRAIEARLDADSSLVTARYVLEVSSPGLERPLFSIQDFEKFSGKKAKVKKCSSSKVSVLQHAFPKASLRQEHETVPF